MIHGADSGGCPCYAGKHQTPRTGKLQCYILQETPTLVQKRTQCTVLYSFSSAFLNCSLLHCVIIECNRAQLSMLQSFQGQLQNALICKSSSASNSFSRISVSFQGQLKMQLLYRIASSHFLSTMIVSSEYILYDSSVFSLHFSLRFASHCNINCTLHRRHESSLPRPVSATFHRLVATQIKD